MMSAITEDILIAEDSNNFSNRWRIRGHDHQRQTGGIRADHTIMTPTTIPVQADHESSQPTEGPNRPVNSSHRKARQTSSWPRTSTWLWQPVLRHGDLDLWKVEHLTTLHLHHTRPGQVSLALAAPRRMMNHHEIRGGHHLQRGPR